MRDVRVVAMAVIGACVLGACGRGDAASAPAAAAKPAATSLASVHADAPGIAWFGNESGMANVRRILARPGRVELTIRFLDPLAGEALANRKTMTAAAQAAIAGALAR